MLDKIEPNAPKDFDFLIDAWKVKHRRLKKALNSCAEWVDFEGHSTTSRTLGGFGNLEDNLLHFPDDSFRAVALRSFNKETKQWSIWWLDGRFPDTLDVPVVGNFSDDIGLFFAEDELNGESITVRFKWNALNPKQPRWEQAFSNDGGMTWETNWTMDFSPMT
ncbi:DUF1579 domain-containing protein [Marinomonas sp. 42_23_T18]|nr:DUF1579 domain-containing protein [Marinomonas sp. 42_23_T18]